MLTPLLPGLLSCVHRTCLHQSPDVGFRKSGPHVRMFFVSCARQTKIPKTVFVMGYAEIRNGKKKYCKKILGKAASLDSSLISGVFSCHTCSLLALLVFVLPSTPCERIVTVPVAHVYDRSPSNDNRGRLQKPPQTKGPHCFSHVSRLP